ncbi:cyclase family protein [Candidatus Neptunichlamydia sp. REUL1]|uniref:cyclase family protein n=1 Tax=Candidatus Neptunichlamydia sp. REUL1 TaxID=3064277 RepID=UPI002930398C|nr:cyclase family protein [Candidatus Neptunochlamydia sp. REUL1]
MSYVDLSIPLEPNLSEPESVEIDSVTHREGAEILTKNSAVSPDSFPDGLGLNLERIKITSHSGTHIDAPFHYGPYCNNKKSRSIDQIPLSWFHGVALVLDCSTHASSCSLTLEEAKQALSNQELEIEKEDIVLLFTGADALWGTPEYFTDFRGIDLSVCKWLVDLGVRVIGVDTFGFDLPFHKMLSAYEKTQNSGVLWPCHMFGRESEYCQIERLTNLASLPKRRKFEISCFPIKLKNCGAAPARVVATILDEKKNE